MSEAIYASQHGRRSSCWEVSARVLTIAVTGRFHCQRKTSECGIQCSNQNFKLADAGNVQMSTGPICALSACIASSPNGALHLNGSAPEEGDGKQLSLHEDQGCMTSGYTDDVLDAVG
ncbi:hypothetical protein B0H10DRAFT_1940526 [Mycena sp. CBHHK59/15]|nr:hypothetical protein B0H10DRAFT_1940526 [Mycena sp. CBHHK59/15]